MRSSSLEQELENFVIQEQEKYYRLAYSYVKNADDALDIVQESIYKAVASIDSLKNPGYIKTWFYRIVVNTALDFLRQSKKVVIVEEEVLSGFSESKVDTYADLDLQRAMEKLPLSYRSIIVLRFFEDLKIEEVAEVLDVNVNTVKTRLYKALEKLRLEIKNQNEGD
ncbi:MAG TPA: sigma-70 family RNA polymerase sigma factor [Clostridia bacterium]|jgi:RNA polymerase sigma-70 factor (ECF subfamily)|nr:sigma-70 family RNA polymerase sigma factor [Clostridia bacterium]HHY06745.1 sigma-70 family RNA polymerase sigma factor [Clostridia bacterium]